MIYTTEEIRQTMVDLANSRYGASMNDRKNQDVCNRAVDMMDDLLHALDVWNSFASYLSVHSMIPNGNPEELARFWNRDQDKGNTRVWTGK